MRYVMPRSNARRGRAVIRHNGVAGQAYHNIN